MEMYKCPEIYIIVVGNETIAFSSMFMYFVTCVILFWAGTPREAASIYVVLPLQDGRCYMGVA